MPDSSQQPPLDRRPPDDDIDHLLPGHRVVLLINDFFEFSRYSGYIFPVPATWRKDDTQICGRRGVVVSGFRRMNEVNARRARLVPG